MVRRSFATLLLLAAATVVNGQEPERLVAAPVRLTQPIDALKTVPLRGAVRKELTPDRDLGLVEDGAPVRLFLALKRSDDQQADLENLLARQQEKSAAEYHKWLTPKEFGARFGLAQEDLAKISSWLESQGFEVKSVQNNASTIDFEATAGGIRNAFHTQLHYWNVQGGKYVANAQIPKIPVALAGVVGGITGLDQIPPRTHHTPLRKVIYDDSSHRFDFAEAASEGIKDESIQSESGIHPDATIGGGGLLTMGAQDFYTIYNVNPILNAGNLGAGRTVAVVESSDMAYGTVNASTGAATGGDVLAFRKVFGVPGTLNMRVLHGYGSVTCTDPGVSGYEAEATLDTEWANALAPSAQLLFMSCSGANGFLTALAAVVDNDLSDTISISYGGGEPCCSTYSTYDTLFSQAAAQGQTVTVASGDAGSDDNDYGTSGTATSGLNVDSPGANPLVTSVGGTDFQDKYDSTQGGVAESTYWSSTNTASYGSALSYVPETVWNDTCAGSLDAKMKGYTGAGYCATKPTNITVVAGGGGYSSHYTQPSWQTGITGLSGSATMRAAPDVSFFSAGGGLWNHLVLFCDSTDNTTCTNASFSGGGGTSFAAPQMAGIAALLVNATRSRQGLLNPALYALAKTQFTAAATKSACYANGQTANTGVTTGLPASSCIFNDVTTGNNDVTCASGSTNCFVNSGATYGMLSTTGASSLTVGYPAGPGYDMATGLGSINVANLINSWSTAFTSSTSLTATPNSLTSADTTVLKATVTGGTPTGNDNGATPAVAGSVNFVSGTTALGSCIISSGSCSLTVSGASLAAGANSVTASFVGSASYPASTSGIVTVTVTSGGTTSQTIAFGALPNVTYGVSPITLTATASSGLPVTYAVMGPATVSGSVLTITGKGSVSVTASQAGNGSISAAQPVTQSFTVAAAQLTVTANSVSRAYGAANPTFTDSITGFVNGDTTAVVGGSASLTTTATTTSPAGNYPITFATQSLTATNYTFGYVAGTLTVSGSVAQTITFGALANMTYGAGAIALNASASSGLAVSYAVTGPATVSGSVLTITGAGTVKVTASQPGNGNYAAATPVAQSFTVAKAGLTVTAVSVSRAAGAANPAFTYTIAGYVNGDSSSVVSGTATETTTATTASAAGNYPITFATESLTATNYSFNYVNGTLTVTSGTSGAPVINYASSFTTAGLNLYGATVTGGALQLTDGSSGETRVAWHTTPVNVQAFTTDFTFQDTAATADGFTFTLQNASAGVWAVGSTGAGLGYGGLASSVAVKFDLYNNAGEGSDSTGFYTAGATPTTPDVDMTASGVNLHSGDMMHAHLSYDGMTLTLTLTDTVTGSVFTTSSALNIPSAVGGNTAYAGFTATSGSQTAVQKILTWTYTVGAGTPAAATPTFTPVAGTYSSAQSVMINDATTAAQIYYTTNGSVPTTASTLYSGSAITVSASETINAIAVASGLSNSAVGTAAYTISLPKVATPTFSPGGGSYATGQTVAIADATTGAQIYYTTNGSTPTTGSTLYSGTISVAATETLNAIAVASGFANSAVATASYTIGAATPPTINYASGFTSTGLNLYGAKITGGALQMTDGGSGETRVGWYTTPVNIQAFTSDFTFQATAATADGFTFVLQNAPAGVWAVGSTGAGLGYGGLASSVAVKFDLYDNAGEGSDSTGVYSAGATPTVPALDMTSSGVNLHSGDILHAHITYSGTTLVLTLTDNTTGATFTTSSTINIPSVVGGNTAYAGFTASSGGMTAVQNILTWTYTVN